MTLQNYVSPLVCLLCFFLGICLLLFFIFYILKEKLKIFLVGIPNVATVNSFDIKNYF